ncbi:unnamed protein product [Rotaria sp. Silwood1]|nr:unnamed protein product [Rotaria sp. Silwood1]CAF1158982.1 unnamed protein product [Rotaria sp. Silwood1]CAF3426831.1 unnamed protein product [Rotaria sp. Silwood1]CAF3468380.1 unnamed protein product [Rotaria sp. Silwood1]CAF3496951.1 unnamed protein product [Rotaria sp. Silwood1]
MSEHTHTSNSSHILSKNKPKNQYFNIIYDNKFYNFHRSSSLIDEITLINNNFQVFLSIALCIVSLMGIVLHIELLIRRYFHMKSFSRHIFIQTLFDFCHLINILFTHSIVIVVYIKTSTNIDIHCPLSAFFFSLASFGFISLICWGAFHQYMYLLKKQTQYRCIHHRLLAHRIILITSMSWLILNFPQFNLNGHS